MSWQKRRFTLGFLTLLLGCSSSSDLSDQTESIDELAVEESTNASSPERSLQDDVDQFLDLATWFEGEFAARGDLGSPREERCRDLADLMREFGERLSGMAWMPEVQADVNRVIEKTTPVAEELEACLVFSDEPMTDFVVATSLLRNSLGLEVD